MDSDISSTCRVCLKVETSSIPMRKLDKSRELWLECTSLWVIFYLPLFPSPLSLSSSPCLQVPADDPYPQQLCFRCWQKFIAWKEFKIQAIHSDRKLKSSPAVVLVNKEKVMAENKAGKDETSSVHEEAHTLSKPERKRTRQSRKAADPLASSESSSSPEEDDIDNEESEEESSEESLKAPIAKRPRPNPATKRIVRPLVECPVCKKFFKGNRDLTRHSIIHTGDKPFKCDLCGNAFSRKDNLESHIRTHTREKPYQCDICFNFFAHKSSLNTHRYRHDEDRPFKCELCDKGFFRNYHLSLHMESHKESHKEKKDKEKKKKNHKL